MNSRECGIRVLDSALFGEAGYMFHHPKEKFDGTSRGILYCHPHNSDYTSPSAAIDVWQETLCSVLASYHYIVLSARWGSLTNWGNAQSTTDMNDAHTWLTGAGGAKTGRVGLIGCSMGFTTEVGFWNAHPTKVACVGGLLPAVDTEALYARDVGLATTLDAAYSGNFATNGAPRNPVDVASGLTARPMKLWYASDDASILASEIETMRSLVPGSTKVDIGPGGHVTSTVAKINEKDYVSFFESGSWS